MPTNISTRSAFFATAAIAAAMVLSCFAPLFSGDRVLGYRDAANFYFPLTEWQSSQWARGRLPLWNRFDGIGTPSLAQTTSSTLYPAKLLFAAPLPFRYRYHLYVIAHLVLAVASATAAARAAGSSVAAASLCGISYGFAGAVFFQIYNVVFLVGAAWLPLALLAAERVVTRASVAAVLGLGVVLALLTLGGDPQAAYHVGLLAILYSCLRVPRLRGIERIRWLGGRCCLLLCGALLAVLLAAAQILPALEWTRHSDRALRDAPSNLYEAVAAAAWPRGGPPRSAANSLVSLVAPPPSETHAARVYQFSVAPWELASLLWPNVCGDAFPVNHRWLAGWSQRDRVWVPSFYFGLLPLLLAVVALGRRRQTPRSRWLAVAACWFIVGSFGSYGIGWLFNLATQFNREAAVSNPAGGIYWWMAMLLPGYSYFRYPAKLMVVASLILGLAAAAGWDRLARSQFHQLRRPLLGIATVSGLLAATCYFAIADFIHWVPATQADPIFGPLLAGEAQRAVAFAFAHTAGVAAAMYAVVRWAPTRSRQLLLIAVTGIELVVADQQLVATVPIQLVRRESAAVTEISMEERSRWRFLRSKVTPPAAWRTQPDPARLVDVVAWERATLHPRYHLVAGVSLLESLATMHSRDLQVLMQVRQEMIAQTDLYDTLSVKYRLESKAESLAVERTASAFPRAWLVERLTVLPELESSQRSDLLERTKAVFFAGGRPRDLRTTAVVESSVPPPSDSAKIASGGVQECSIESIDHQRVVIRVECQRRSLLVLNDLWYPGWSAYLNRDGDPPRKARLYRTNRVMRGVSIPPGRHQLALVYEPGSFWWGLAASGLAWCGLGLGLVLSKVSAGWGRLG